MIRPNEQRAKYAITFLWIMLGIRIAALVSGYFQYNLLQDFNNGVIVPDGTAEANDQRQMFISIVYLIGLLSTGYLFIQWFRRAYYNLQIISPNKLSHAEEWALWSWIVPIISLYRSFNIMKEMYREARELLIGQDVDQRKFDFQLLGWWWGCWIGSNLVSQISSRIPSYESGMDGLLASSVGGMISDVLSIAAAVLVVKVVRNYCYIESHLYAATGELGMDRLINSIGKPEEPRQDDLSLQEEY